MDKEQIEKRIKELEQRKAQFIEQANREIAFIEGQIAALRELAAEDETDD